MMTQIKLRNMLSKHYEISKGSGYIAGYKYIIEFKQGTEQIYLLYPCRFTSQD